MPDFISLLKTKIRVPWLLQLVYDFPYAMDLVDEVGAPDHDKMLPAFAAVAFVVFIFMHPQPSWEAMLAWIILGGYVYGFSAWRVFATAAATRLKGAKHAEPAQPEPPQDSPSDSR